MPSSNQPGGFVSYGELYNLNKDELQRMQREAEERWQSADAADEAAKRGYGQAKAEAEKVARASGYENEGKFFGGYSDYVRQRDSAAAQWKAYRERMRQSQMAARSTFEQAAGGGPMKAAGDDEDWAGMDAAFTADVKKAAGQYKRPQQQAAGYNPQPMAQSGRPTQQQINQMKARADEARRRADAAKARRDQMGRSGTFEQAQQAEREWQAAEAEWQQLAELALRPTASGYAQYNQPQQQQQRPAVTGTGSYTPPQQQQTSGTGSYKPPGT